MRKKRYSISVMTKNIDMFKNSVCPEGLAVLEAICCVRSPVQYSALHLAAILPNRPRSSSRTGS
jgi:hypothetical protein